MSEFITVNIQTADGKNSKGQIVMGCGEGLTFNCISI